MPSLDLFEICHAFSLWTSGINFIIYHHFVLILPLGSFLAACFLLPIIPLRFHRPQKKKGGGDIIPLSGFEAG